MGLQRHLVRVLRLLAGLAALFLIVGTGLVIAQRQSVVLWVIDSLWSPPATAQDEERVVNVPPGATARDIGALLVQQGLITDARAFSIAAGLMGAGTDLKAGEYRVSPGIRVTSMVTTLREGRNRLVRVVIPEGRRAEEIAEIIAASGVAEKTDLLRLIKAGDSARLQNERPSGSTLEGYLFPETYLVPPDFGAAKFIDLMLATFENRVPPSVRNQASPQGLTFYQTLVLASIVERETAVADERPLVAGVFLNRLEAGPPPAADPTIQYALAFDPQQQRQFGWWKRDLTYDDLALVSAFNTYKLAALPPSPICNPGLAAIEAVLHPKESDYVYFVARPDGTHAFAETFEEHQRNIARYRQ